MGLEDENRIQNVDDGGVVLVEQEPPNPRVPNKVREVVAEQEPHGPKFPQRNRLRLIRRLPNTLALPPAILASRL